MKTEKKLMKKKLMIDFSPLVPLMGAVHRAEIKLMDALLALWEKTDSDPMEFRRAFVAFAVSKGYTEKWAGEIACAAGFRLRSAGGGRKPSAKSADKVTKVLAFIAKLDMTKAELAKLAKQLAK